MRFKDKVVVVTGSSKGIGSHLAVGYATEGAKVVVNYNSDLEGAMKTSEKIKALGSECLVIKSDVSETKAVKDMFEQIISEYDKVDVLVNNAGIYDDSTVWKMSEEIWDNVIDTSLKGVFNCTKYATNFMRSEGAGRILNISSVVAQTGAFGASNYSAAKSGIFGFTRSVAQEIASKNITINTLCLGFIEEGMLLRLSEPLKESIMNKIPLKRWGKPSEVVSTALFLTSEDASYITGQTINLNGGAFFQ